MKAKHLLLLSILACGACDGAPDDDPSPAPGREADVAGGGESITEKQSSLDSGCVFALPTPNFWAAVTYIGDDKIHVPVPQWPTVGQACGAYLNTATGAAALAIGSPYTTTCACKYVCGNGPDNADNGQCGDRRPAGSSALTCSGPSSSHSIICPGPPLQPCTTVPCIQSICSVDPYCCNTYWDDICVNEVTSVCGINWDVRAC